jgi:protein gp37
MRFLSIEPLLGPINLTPYQDHVTGNIVNSQGINVDWVIVGGESGTGSRYCHTDWIKSIVQQCQDFGVPVFVKQLGGNTRPLVSDRKGSDMSEWPKSLCVRELPIVEG